MSAAAWGAHEPATPLGKSLQREKGSSRAGPPLLLLLFPFHWGFFQISEHFWVVQCKAGIEHPPGNSCVPSRTELAAACHHTWMGDGTMPEQVTV